MGKMIRRGIFETNSSSTHSLVICSKKQYEDWGTGKALFIRDDEKFVEPVEDKTDYRKMYIDKNIEVSANNDGIYILNGSVFTSKEEAYNKAVIEDWELTDMKDEDQGYWSERPVDRDEYWDNIQSEFETFVEHYTTENGDEVVAFGYYGYS